MIKYEDDIRGKAMAYQKYSRWENDKISRVWECVILEDIENSHSEVLGYALHLMAPFIYTPRNEV